MKYDSGMTHFRSDIIAALCHMLGNNTEIIQKFSSNDGSPAPLRDYLKQKYGKSYTSHIGDGMRYSCKTTTGFELTFDTILNNPGDKNLTISWSQVAKFIRDNWDEIFKKAKPKTRPLEVLVKTFDEAAMTCPNWNKGKTLTYLEAVNGVHFECKAFSAEFCKLDDITSFFVGHCNCPENCSYYEKTEPHSENENTAEIVLPKVGDYVEEDMLGELLTFDELSKMEGQLAVDDRSTESRNWYLVVHIGRTVETDEGRRLTYYDKPKLTPKNTCVVGEWAFNVQGTHILGGKEVTRSQRFWRLKQTAKNIAEEGKQPSYIDKLREKYPKINIEDEWFFEDYCPSDIFVGENLPYNADSICRLNGNINNVQVACPKCWTSPCADDIYFREDIGDFEDDYFEHYPAEDTAEAIEAAPEISEEKSESDKSIENQVATTTETALQGAFDYSELDSDTTEKLRAISERVISIKATYIIETAKQVKAAHDLLANHYKGLFGAWCESVGFTRQTGNNLVHVAETFPDFMLSNAFDNISARLLYEASKPSAPPELVEQVKNGDITKHKDYMKLKAELDRTREEFRQLDENSAAKDKEYEQQLAEAEMQSRTYQKNYLQMEKNFNEVSEENTRLSLEIKELEKRPIDVYVDHNEVTRLVTEAVSKINSETEQTIAAREQEFAETLHFKDERIWELEDKLKELSAGNTGKKVYMLTMTDEEYLKMSAELISGDLRKILVTAAVIDPNGKRGGGNG